MTHAIELRTDAQKRDEASVDAIARETETSVDVVKVLYQEEIQALTAQARVKQFVTVLAMKRVKQQLRALGTPH
jgi:hypothetical protein